MRTPDGLRAILSQHPRVVLAHAPTLLEDMPRLSAHLGGPRLLVKRDDCTGLATGGSEAGRWNGISGLPKRRAPTRWLSRGQFNPTMSAPVQRPRPSSAWTAISSLRSGSPIWATPTTEAATCSGPAVRRNAPSVPGGRGRRAADRSLRDRGDVEGPGQEAVPG